MANSGGGGLDAGIVGYEFRTRLTENSTRGRSRISFTSYEPSSYSIVTSQTLRGKGAKYTIYATTRSVCTVSAVATRVSSPAECASRAHGFTENENEWSASFVPLQTKVAISELEYMCVGGDAAYVPTARWMHGDEVCECTVEYQVACPAP